MPTIAYLRVSTDQHQSVDAQRAEIVIWAASTGVPEADIEWYIDEGASGAAVSRPNWDRLQGRLEALRGSGSTLVVYSLDRLFRWEPADQIEWLLKMRRLGVRVFSITEQGAEFSTLQGQLLSVVGAHMRHEERLKIVARVTSGVRNALTVGVRDRVTKAPSGDTRWGGQRLSPGSPGGPRLTEEQEMALVEAVRGGATYSGVAARFGVTRATAKRIVTRRLAASLAGQAVR